MPSPLIGNLFPRFTEAEWAALAAHSVGLDDLAPLAATTEDGLPIAPIYAAGSGKPVAGRTPGAPWTIVQRIAAADPLRAAAAIEAAVAGGANGIELVFAASPVAHEGGLPHTAPLATLLGRPVPILRIDAGPATIARAVEARERGLAGEVIAAFDPFATLAAVGGLPRPLEAELDAIADLARLSGTGAGQAAVADGRPWHDAGATDATELAATLASFVALLRAFEARGIAPAAAAPRIGLVASVDADQFLSIAKLRALRLLVGRVLELAGAGDGAPRLHAETAWRMMSRRDPHTNLLRTTTAAFAAAVGGADSLSVLDFAPRDDGLGARLARNTQSILADEASLARFADPGAGSGAIEALTRDLAEAAWTRFATIEREGGILAVLRGGGLQRTIAASRDERAHRVARREIELIGVNVFCDRGPAEDLPPLPARERAGTAETVTPLAAMRLSEPFERLVARSAGLAAAGRASKVVLALLGPPADHGEAAAEAADLFATAAIACVSADVSAAPAMVAETGARRPVACLCAARNADAGEVAAAAVALAAAGCKRLYVAGPPPGPGMHRLPGRGDDIVAALSEVLDAIAATPENGQT